MTTRSRFESVGKRQAPKAPAQNKCWARAAGSCVGLGQRQCNGSATAVGRSGHASRRSDQGLARLPLFFAHHGSCGCARDAVALLAGGPAAGARSRSRRDTDAAPGRRWATPSRLHYSSSEASGEWGPRGVICGILDGAAARCDTWSTPAVVVSTIDCRGPPWGIL